MSDNNYDKPLYHVAPQQGWVNDPNGPFMYCGKYHLFYQHLPEGCEWAFGLVWGHSVSSDLIHWEHLPHAVVPTEKSLDAAGCFSGCATIDTDGTPIILYTGVRLRTDPDAQPLPPKECDLNLPFIESQLFAIPTNTDDALLIHWTKEPKPFIGLPPPHMNLTGWRDPFVIERPCEANNHEWVVLMGSGIKEVGGATIVYRTRQLRDPSSWRYDGLLCVGEGNTGAVWECPLLVELNPLPAAGIHLGSSAHDRLASKKRHSISQLANLVGSPKAADQQQQHQQPWSPAAAAASDNNGNWPGQLQLKGPLPLCNPCGTFPGFICSTVPLSNWDDRYTHFYSISPDAATNPTIYWLGRYHDGRFDLDSAKGPIRLDLGDVLYAPNIQRDDSGRVIMWGWLQERRTVGTYDYAGCMTVPRFLHLDYDRLHQCPAPEIMELRTGETWQCGHVTLGPEASLPLSGVVSSRCLDIEVVFTQGSASTVGILLRSWHQAGEGGAAVLFNWESGLLEVVFEALDPSTMTFSLTAPLARRIGGPITHKPGAPLALRMLLDGSCLEIFTGSGEVLSTRIYRGKPPHDHADAGIEFVALDGEATLERVAAYEMTSIWTKHKQQPHAQQVAAAADVADGLEGLDLEGLDLDRLTLAAEQQREGVDTLLEKTLSTSPGSRSNISLLGSFKDQQAMARAEAATGKLQQLLSPKAAVAAAGRAGFDAMASTDRLEHLPEEEMTIDIFDLEGL